MGKETICVIDRSDLVSMLSELFMKAVLMAGSRQPYGNSDSWNIEKYT